MLCINSFPWKQGKYAFRDYVNLGHPLNAETMLFFFFFSIEVGERKQERKLPSVQAGFSNQIVLHLHSEGRQTVVNPSEQQ